MSEAISRKLRPETRQRLAKAAIALLFALIFLLGLCTVDDYGRNWDEKGEINIYRMALMEYGEILPFETGFHQALKAMGVIPLSQSIEMDHNLSLIHICQGAQKGLFITTGTFTKEARSYVEKQLSTKVVLVDGEKLTKLMIEYNLGVSVETVYTIKKIDTDFFSEEND